MGEMFEATGQWWSGLMLAAGGLLLGLAVATVVQKRRYATRAASLQAATAHYQQFLRQVIDTNPHLIFVKDWEGRFVLANAAMAQFHGTTVESLIGKRDSDFSLKEEEAEQFLRDDREVMSSQQPRFIVEEPATCARTGSTRWF